MLYKAIKFSYQYQLYYSIQTSIKKLHENASEKFAGDEL